MNKGLASAKEVCLVRTSPAYKGPDPYAFVCYAHADRPAVFAEIRRLQDSGLRLWFDDGIQAGSEWSGAIAEAIERCSVFIYFISPSSVANEFCRRELNFAMEQKCTTLTVHLEPTDVPAALRLSLGHRQAILKYDDERYAQKLDSALQLAVEGEGDALAEELAPAVTPAPVRQKSSVSWRLWMMIAVAVVASVVGGWWLIGGTTPSPQTPAVTAKSGSWQQRAYEAVLKVAVLPLKDISSDQDYERFAGGVTQSVRYQLSQEGKYDVVPTHLSDGASLPEDVDRVVDGSVRIANDELVVDIEVFDPASGRRIITDRISWTMQADEQLHDSVSTYLTKFLDTTLEAGGPFGPTTPAAKRIFRRSIQFLADETDTDETLVALEEITAMEPGWLRGWVMLGTYFWNAAVFSSDPSILKKSAAAYQQALRHGIDPKELQISLAFLAWFEGDLDLAERRFATAGLDSQTPLDYALFMKAAGLIEESLPVIEKHTQIWPYHVYGWRRLVETCYALVDPACVLEAEERRKAIVSPDRYLIKSEAIWAYGKLKNAQALREIRDSLVTRMAALEAGSTAYIVYFSNKVTADFHIALIEGEHTPELLENLARSYNRVYRLLQLGKHALAQEVANKSLARPTDVTLWHWTEGQWWVPEEYRDHEITQRFRETSGYTAEWRLEVCRRVEQQFPPESGLSCDPDRYLMANGESSPF